MSDISARLSRSNITSGGKITKDGIVWTYDENGDLCINIPNCVTGENLKISQEEPDPVVTGVKLLGSDEVYQPDANGCITIPADVFSTGSISEDGNTLTVLMQGVGVPVDICLDPLKGAVIVGADGEVLSTIPVIDGILQLPDLSQCWGYNEAGDIVTNIPNCVTGEMLVICATQVKSVTGVGVNNDDPQNPVINVPVLGADLVNEDGDLIEELEIVDGQIQIPQKDCVLSVNGEEPDANGDVAFEQSSTATGPEGNTITTADGEGTFVCANQAKRVELNILSNMYELLDQNGDPMGVSWFSVAPENRVKNQIVPADGQVTDGNGVLVSATALGGDPIVAGRLVAVECDPDGNVVNVVVFPVDTTVGVEYPDGSLPSFNSTTNNYVLECKGVSLVKKSESTFINAGDVVQYSYLVVNGGSLPIVSATIEDDVIGTITVAPVPIPVGGSVTVTAPYTVTAADVVKGSVTNNAIVTSVDEDGQKSVDADCETVYAAIRKCGLMKEEILLPINPVLSGDTVNGNPTKITYEFVSPYDGVVACANLSVDNFEELIPGSEQFFSGQGGAGNESTSIWRPNFIGAPIFSGAVMQVVSPNQNTGNSYTAFDFPWAFDLTLNMENKYLGIDECKSQHRTKFVQLDFDNNSVMSPNKPWESIACQFNYPNQIAPGTFQVDSLEGPGNCYIDFFEDDLLIGYEQAAGDSHAVSLQYFYSPAVLYYCHPVSGEVVYARTAGLVLPPGQYVNIQDQIQ